MARRLGPTLPPDSPTVKPTHYVAARTKGLQLIAGLQPITIERIVSIDTPEGYLQMDARLASIRNVRAQWKLALEPIAGPLELAIKKQKESLAAAKKAADGVMQLDKEVSSKLDVLEGRAKQLMADYKTREQRRLNDEREAQARETQRLLSAANQRRQQAEKARTPQLKARFEQQSADLEAQAEAVQTEEVAPIKGASSTSRTQQKVRVSDPLKFFAAVQDYEPTAGVYEIGHPPLMVTDRNGQPTPLVEVVAARLNELFREQPGVVASWPGIEVFDDITIAGR